LLVKTDSLRRARNIKPKGKTLMNASEQHSVRWEYDEYKILQLIQCAGVQAVYAQDDEDNPGKYKLEGYPIRFLAVAKKTTRFFEKPKDLPLTIRAREYRDAEVDNVIVGVELAGGYFVVCNDASNFAGYCHEGDDITNATAYLSYRDYPLST
jgi:hypothetical protein